MPQNRTAGGRAIPRVSAGQAYLGLGQRANKRMPPDYAKDLAYLMQVDPRDKAEMDKARKALEKAMRNIVSAGADYEAVLAELSKVQKANTGKDGKPKDLKELKEMRQELKEVLTVINKLSKRQAVSDESLATLSPLMKKLAESISAIKMGQLGTADLHAAMMASGAGKKTDVEGLAKIYKKNTELARKDWHTFMSQALKLQQSVGSRRDALSKELLTPFLGNTSPTVHTLKEMLGEDKSFYNAVKEYWSNSLKESQIVRRERETQAARFENQGEAKENSERMFQEETLEHDKVLLKTTKEIKSLLEDLNATATSSQILEATQVVESAINGGGSGADLLPLDTSLKTLAMAAARLAGAVYILYEGVTAIKDLRGGKQVHEWKDVHSPADFLNYVGTRARDLDKEYPTFVGDVVDRVENLGSSIVSGDAGAKATSKRELDAKYRAGKATVAELATDAANKAGLNPQEFAALLGTESGGGLDNASQYLRPGSAVGPGQLFGAAWTDVTKGNARKNLPRDADITNYRQNLQGAADYVAWLKERLKGLGVADTPENTKLAYFLGPDGVKDFDSDLRSNPDAPVTPIDPKALGRNKEVFNVIDPKTKKIVRRKTNREVKDYIKGVMSANQLALERMEGYTVQTPQYNKDVGFSEGQMFKVTPSAAPSVNRAPPISPAPAPVQQAPASPPANPVGQNAENPVSIDSIPMFVDDTGLMLISIGGLV